MKPITETILDEIEDKLQKKIEQPKLYMQFNLKDHPQLQGSGFTARHVYETMVIKLLRERYYGLDTIDSLAKSFFWGEFPKLTRAERVFLVKGFVEPLLFYNNVEVRCDTVDNRLSEDIFFIEAVLKPGLN